MDYWLCSRKKLLVDWFLSWDFMINWIIVVGGVVRFVEILIKLGSVGWCYLFFKLMFGWLRKVYCK